METKVSGLFMKISQRKQMFPLGILGSQSDKKIGHLMNLETFHLCILTWIHYKKAVISAQEWGPGPI